MPAPAARRSRTRPCRRRTARAPRSQPLGGERGAREDVAHVAEPVLAGRHRAPALRRALAACSAAAISPTLRGVPLATLNAPGTASSAVSARTFARATSRTWTKSRSWPPSSKTRGARPAASALREDRRDAGVGRVARHPRPVDVVVAQRRHRHAGLAAEGRGEVLLVQLRRGVDVARVRRRVLGDAARRQRRAAARARRLEAAGVEVGAQARAGPDEPVLGAGVAPFAVDDHARREHEPAGEAGRARARAAGPRCRGRCAQT